MKVIPPTVMIREGAKKAAPPLLPMPYSLCSDRPDAGQEATEGQRDSAASGGDLLHRIGRHARLHRPHAGVSLVWNCRECTATGRLVGYRPDTGPAPQCR